MVISLMKGKIITLLSTDDKFIILTTKEDFLFNYVGTLIQRKELQKGEEGGEKEKKRKNKWTNWLVN